MRVEDDEARSPDKYASWQSPLARAHSRESSSAYQRHHTNGYRSTSTLPLSNIPISRIIKPLLRRGIIVHRKLTLPLHITPSLCAYVPDPALPAMFVATAVASGLIPLSVTAHCWVGLGVASIVAVMVAVGMSICV